MGLASLACVIPITGGGYRETLGATPGDVPSTPRTYTHTDTGKSYIRIHKHDFLLKHDIYLLYTLYVYYIRYDILNTCIYSSPAHEHSSHTPSTCFQFIAMILVFLVGGPPSFFRSDPDVPHVSRAQLLSFYPSNHVLTCPHVYCIGSFGKNPQYGLTLNDPRTTLCVNLSQFDHRWQEPQPPLKKYDSMIGFFVVRLVSTRTDQ